MIAPPYVPVEVDEYLLRTPTMGPSTPPPSEKQPATDALALVSVNLPDNSPRSSPRRATTAGGAKGTGERYAVVADKHGKKGFKGTPNNLVGKAVMRVPRGKWYIRYQFGT